MAKKTVKKTRKSRAKTKTKTKAKTTSKKRVAKSAKKPAPSWFGLVIDGKRTPYGLPSLEDAQLEAAALGKQGYKVAIYDQDTGRIVKRT